MAQEVCILNQEEPYLYPSQFDTLYPGRNITLSFHLPHAFPCIENRYVPLLELVFITYDTRSLLCIIEFTCYEKKRKIWVGREYYIVIGRSCVTFEQSTKLLSPCIIVILGLAWP
jgi:hypothetical protein